MQSNEAPESLSEEYLCDYLYLDTQRLAYFYSQLSENGLVTQSKRSSRSGGQQDTKLSAGPRWFSGELRQGTTADESVEHQIDPAFSRPQETLDALFDQGYLVKSMGVIGQLCLLDGLLSMVDLRMMREMWAHMGPMVAQQASAGASSFKEKQKLEAEAKKSYKDMAEILQRLPHALQGSFATKEGSAWFTLKPEFMLVNPDDFMFKFGMDLAGIWHVVFLVDAYPDTIFAADHSELFDTEMERAMRPLIKSMRQGFGRPADRWGITPIMIFRKLSKPGQDATSEEPVDAGPVPNSD